MFNADLTENNFRRNIRHVLMCSPVFSER